MRRKVGAALISALLIQGSMAAEFANIFGSNETEQRSRQASATALSAIQNIIDAVRLRELQESEGTEQFLNAAALLETAYAEMEKVLADGFPDLSIPEEQISVMQTASAVYTQYGVSVAAPSNLREAYETFQSMTIVLSKRLADVASTPLNEPAYPMIAPLLSGYLSYANVVSEIGRTAR